MHEGLDNSTVEGEKRLVSWMEKYLNPLGRRINELYWVHQKQTFEVPEDVRAQVDSITKRFYAAYNDGNRNEARAVFEELESFYKSEAEKRGRPVKSREEY